MSRIIPLTLAAVVVAGCGGGGNEAGNSTFLVDKLEGVCRGTAVREAPAYDESAAIRPVVVMEGDGTTFEQTYGDYPEEWKATIGTAENAQVAVCIEQTSRTEVQVCGGYEDDGDEPLTVTIFDATYAVTVYAANSAKELASEEITVPNDGCPLVVSFPEGETTTDYVEPYTEQVTKLIEPYVVG
jgi:hypothetical protein